MAYKFTLPTETEALVADAMWWKYYPGTLDATDEQKQAHLYSRVREFLVSVARDYRVVTETEEVLVGIRDQINVDMVQVAADIVVEQVVN